jgi:hypothetical protein
LDPAGQHNLMKRCKHVNLVSSSNVDGEEEFLFAPWVPPFLATPPLPPLLLLVMLLLLMLQLPPSDTAYLPLCLCTRRPVQPTLTPSSST